MTIMNTTCHIVVVRLDHDITGNLSIDLERQILSFTERFQQTIKFRLSEILKMGPFHCNH